MQFVLMRDKSSMALWRLDIIYSLVPLYSLIFIVVISDLFTFRWMVCAIQSQTSHSIKQFGEKKKNRTKGEKKQKKWKMD